MFIHFMQSFQNSAGGYTFCLNLPEINYCLPQTFIPIFICHVLLVVVSQGVLVFLIEIHKQTLRQVK